MQIGCLLIHGFTGAPYEVLPLAEYLSNNGFIVEVPTLTGHGSDLSNLRGVSYESWIKDAEASFNKLQQRCDQVVVIGFSMGGLLAIDLACKHSISGLVTLSTPIFVWDLRRMGLNLLAAVRLKEFRRIKEYASRAIGTPFSAVVSFQRLLRKAKKRIPEVKVPVLIVQGRKDDTVKAKSAAHIYRKIGSANKQVHYLPESQHVICCGPETEALFTLVLKFLRQL